MKYFDKIRWYLLGLVGFVVMAGAGMTLQGQALADAIDTSAPVSTESAATTCTDVTNGCAAVPAATQPSNQQNSNSATDPGNSASTTSPPAAAAGSTPADTLSDALPGTSTSTAGNDTNVGTATQQAATSGDANVSGTGGSNVATTGNATDSLTQVNAAGSTVGSGALTVYTQNISGDQTGNITINPNDATQVVTVPVNVINGTGNSTLTNTVTAGTQTGDATITADGGNNAATSGNADVSANVVNVVDSTVADQNTFVGTVNIYGTLSGDILIPQSFLNQLLTDSGTAAAASQTSSQSAVSNTVTLVAISGNAAVIGAGTNNQAISGNATTSLNQLNYVGNTTGSNLLLIIINVLGHWYGAVLQPQITTTSPTDGSASNTALPAVQATSAQTINNTIQLTAISGNALITGDGSNNTAISGNALVAANIVNLVNDHLTLGGWFGVLFINVFGTWTGNLATYNDQGQTTPAVIITTPATPVSVVQNLCATAIWKCISYVPHQAYYTYYTTYTTPGAPTDNAVLASATIHNAGISSARSGNVPGSISANNNAWLRTLLFILPGMLLILLERYVSHRQKRVRG